jgi:16S rRNA processing protein RimM
LDVLTGAIDMAAKKLCVGVIAGAHGVRGEVRVKSFTADPDALVDYGPFTDKKGDTEFVFEVTGRSRGMLLGRVNGVKDRDLADAQRGTELYIDRDMLPQPEEDEFYYADLTGLAVVLEDGSAFGVVRAVQEYGAGDMIEIALNDGQTTLLPFTRAIFPTIDLAAGRLVAVVPEDTYASAEHMGSDHADGEISETEKEPS